MADTITYFGDPIRATYPNGGQIVVNGRSLLIPPNFNLQNEINAAHYAAARLIAKEWVHAHYALGSSGDPQRQAGYSGGFDPRYTDAGNYGYGLSAAAAGYTLEGALRMAAEFNQHGTGRPLPALNEAAIRQGFSDYVGKRFSDPDHHSGSAYLWSTLPKDTANVVRTVNGFINPPERTTESDVKRYARAHWGDLNSPDAQAFMANFAQAFGGYPQHVDLDLLQPLPADGSIPSGKDVSLFVGKNGEVLVYAKPPAPGGRGALRGIYGLDGAPNGSGGTGLNFFEDGTPRPISVQPHLATASDPTSGIDVTLPDGSREHWWQDQPEQRDQPGDGFIRARLGQPDSVDGASVPSPRAGRIPGGVVPNSSPSPSPSSDDHSEVSPSFDNPSSPLLRELIRRRSSAAPDAPASSTTAFEMPGSTFGRLFVEAAHRAANGLLPSAEAAPLPVASSDATGAPAVPYVPPVASIAPGRPNIFSDRFGDWSAPSPPQSAQIDPRDVRVLSSRIAGTPATSVFDTGAPAVPYVPSGVSIAPDRQDTFNDRFGNWTTPQASPAQSDAQKTRVLRGFVVGPDGSQMLLPGPEQAPQPEDRPKAGYGLPLSISGLPDQSASGGDMDDWLARWMPLFRQ